MKTPIGGNFEVTMLTLAMLDARGGVTVWLRERWTERVYWRAAEAQRQSGKFPVFALKEMN